MSLTNEQACEADLLDARAKIKHLQVDNDVLRAATMACAQEIERLRAALRRIDNESNCDVAAQIAQEALSDEQSPKLTEPDENGRQYEEGMRPSDDAEFGCKP